MTDAQRIVSDFDEAKRSKFVAIVTKMLETQKVAAAGASIFDYDNQVNRKALGYICGFITAALEIAGQDKNDSELLISIAYDVMKFLFPGHEVKLLEFLIQAARRKDEVLKMGMELGGQEFIECTESENELPQGFTRFLLEGDNIKPLH